jgi:lipopolysaccharide export system permease protein
VMIAVAVSSVNPRAGRSGNLVFALFAFVLYYNLLNLGQTWIASGRTTFGGFLLALHGGVALGGMLWLAQQHNNWSLRHLRRRPPATAPESA